MKREDEQELRDRRLGERQAGKGSGELKDLYRGRLVGKAEKDSEELNRDNCW